MNAQQAVELLHKKEETWNHTQAFFEAAKEAGMSASDFGKLLQSARKGKTAKVKIGGKPAEIQGTLF